MSIGSQSASIIARTRWYGALAAVAALTALVVIGPPGDARAATVGGTGYDQITGAGSTNSALTVPWTQGLLDTTNKPIAAANGARTNSSSPLWFMYQQFQALQVTVSQTQDITNQGITVKWQGAQQTVNNDGVQANFLQLMECYGDANSGPSPQDCEFGSQGLIAPGTANVSVGTRDGGLCQPGGPSVANPPPGLDNSNPLYGCDPEEPGSASPPDIATGDPVHYSIPFVPVNDPTNPAYNGAVSQYFDQFTTNEVQEAVTGSNDSGQLQFETQNAEASPSLGCGGQESNGQTRNCWLVVVPRGIAEPNGYEIPNINSSQPGDYLYSSPLSATNWAMRIQIRLNYAPVGTFCPIGTQQVQTVGTQIIARAVQSWQLALNATAKCSTVYGYTAVPEATSTQQLALSGSPAGLAFTTIPIGSEAARAGGGGGTATLPPILYAPVAVSAVGFGFNINESKGYDTTPVKLTPELLAKSLTQVYQTDLPDVYPNFPGPKWVQKNPTNFSDDPQFIKLNSDAPAYGFSSIALAPLLTEDHSGINQQIWQWIQSDPAMDAWLNNGTTDATNSITPDPDYTALQLGTPPAIDSFPRAYSGVLDLGKSSSGKEEQRRSLDLLPYVNNYQQAAANILTGNTGTTGTWSDQAIAPDGSTGWWQKNAPETLGETFIWGIVDTADLASYGLIDAQLCDDAGNNCVGPSTASLTAALNAAKTDSAGLLQVNPASPGTNGYPLTQVTYAAVDTTRPAADLTDYANLIAYAVGAGQTAGVAPGDLPPGYLPLTASLKAQAMAVVAKLRADAKASASPSPSSGTTSRGSASGTTAPTSSSASASGSGQLVPTVSSATPTVGLSISPPSAQLAATRTGRQPVGAIRWALMVVVLAGAACAAGGIALRSGSVARWLKRPRT